MAPHRHYCALPRLAAVLVGVSLLSTVASGQTATQPITPLPGTAAPQYPVPTYQGVPVLTAQNVVPLDPNDPCPPFVYCEDPNVCPPCPEACPPYMMQQQPMWVMPQQQPVYQQQPMYQQQPIQAVPQVMTVPQQPAVIAQPVPAPLQAQQIYGQNVSPVYAHKHKIFGEFLYMRPRNAEVPYALPINGPVAEVLGNEVPVGPVAVVEPEFDPGFRVGFALALDPSSSFGAQYTYLRFEGSDSATITAPDVLRALVTHPLGADVATDALDASASQNIDIDIIDAEYRGLIHCCDGFSIFAVNAIAGAEFAKLDQTFNSSYVAVASTTTVNSSVEFDGIGPRVGIQAEQHARQTNLFVYGVGDVNLLVGEFDASYTQTDSLAGTEAFTSWSGGRIVPVVNMELGVGWRTWGDHLVLSAGYRVSAWFNVVTTEDWINSVQANEFSNMSDTLTFDGAVAHAEYRW